MSYMVRGGVPGCVVQASRLALCGQGRAAAQA